MAKVSLISNLGPKFGSVPYPGELGWTMCQLQGPFLPQLWTDYRDTQHHLFPLGFKKRPVANLALCSLRKDSLALLITWTA